MLAVPHRSSYLKSVGDEPLPGYRLIAPLGRGGFGEVWKCIAPGGLQKAIKFVMEDRDSANPSQTPLQQEYQAVQRIKEIRHPFLMTLERVELIDGELLMVMELADKSLANRLDEWRELGQAGIPRSELLSYMVDTAEALDVLSHQYQLQHLDVKPANLFLVGGHAKVGDYGLVDRFENGTGQLKIGRGLTPRYVAPEVLSNQVDPRSDQYTLALVYQELLTGTFPYDATSARDVMMQHMTAEPNLSALPYGDREPTRRALSKKPCDRFPSCLEYVKALLSHAGPKSTSINTVVNSTTPLSMTPSPLRQNTHADGFDGDVTIGRKTPLFNTPALKSSSGIASLTHRPQATSTTTSDEVAQAFPTYRFHSNLEATKRGKIVRAIDNTGRAHRVHFLRLGCEVGPDLEAVLRAAAASHLNLFQTIATPQPSIVAFSVPEELTTLREKHRQLVAEGNEFKPVELLSILRTVAQSLDDLYEEHNCAHLLLNPKHVITRGRTTGITGYGMGELLRRTHVELDWLPSDAYAPPEVLEGEPSATSDQYNLALIFLEIIQAWTPDTTRRTGRATSSIKAIQYGNLKDYEQVAVRRALSENQLDRFENSSAFIAALQPPSSDGCCLDEVRLVESIARFDGPIVSNVTLPTPTAFVEAVMQMVPTNSHGTTAATAVRQADGRWAFRFPVRLTQDMIQLKLVVFTDEWSLQYLQLSGDTYLVRKSSKRSRPGVELTIQTTSTKLASAEIVVLGRSIGGLESNAKQVPVAVAEMMENLRRSLQNLEERRRSPRFPTDLPIGLYAIDDELNVALPITARTQDISATGLCCVVSEPVSMSHAFVSFPTVTAVATCAILSKIVRNQKDGQGQLLIAVQFLLGKQ